MINWAHFPQTEKPTKLSFRVIEVFESISDSIDSSTHDVQVSNEVLAKAAKNFETLGFKVETGKRKADKVRVPVLYGRNGRVEKSFEADAYHEGEGYVIEVEAGRGVVNYQFLKDLFQACMMTDVDYLCIAVRNIYRNSKDFEKVFTFFDTLFKSKRMNLPLKGILIIGY